ncbi:helix-turn-helix transcriptional regulator [Gordonia jinhuaensis]|uniref:helix-turn-helix transcriptional regulator n=1 Tax=Gordonia jinhuaensis TaxID=1517702 RepID=UPI001668B857
MADTRTRDLRDTKGAADYLGIGEHRLRSWRVQGTGPAYLKLGQAVRYDVSDLDEWLDAQRVDPAENRLVARRSRPGIARR